MSDTLKKQLHGVMARQDKARRADTCIVEDARKRAATIADEIKALHDQAPLSDADGERYLRLLTEQGRIRQLLA